MIPLAHTHTHRYVFVIWYDALANLDKTHILTLVLAIENIVRPTHPCTRLLAVSVCLCQQQRS